MGTWGHFLSLGHPFQGPGGTGTKDVSLEGGYGKLEEVRETAQRANYGARGEAHMCCGITAWWGRAGRSAAGCRSVCPGVVRDAVCSAGPWQPRRRRAGQGEEGISEAPEPCARRNFLRELGGSGKGAFGHFSTHFPSCLPHKAPLQPAAPFQAFPVMAPVSISPNNSGASARDLRYGDLRSDCLWFAA